MNEPNKTWGETAYNAYSETRNWKAWDGSPLPKWESVKPDIRVGWEAAGLAVVLAHIAYIDNL